MDDSALVRRVLERLLAEQNLEAVSTAAPPPLGGTDTSSFGAAILDVEIGDASGVDFGRALLDRDPSLPIAFLTGATDPALIKRAIALGPVFEKGDDLSPAVAWAKANAR